MRLKVNILTFFIINCTLSIILSACSTIPRDTAQRDTGDFSLLPEGGKLYLWADVKEAGVLLESISFDGMPLNQAGAILDRTDTAAAVFFGRLTEQGREEEAPGSTDQDSEAPSPGNSFFINLRGKYPSFGAGVSFTFSREWKRTRSETGNSFWLLENTGLGLALNSNLALVSSGDPFLRLPVNSRIPAVRVPDGFDEFRKGGVVSGWIPDNEPVNRFLSDLGIPIQIPAEDFLFNAVKQDDDIWELDFLIRTPSVSQARALVTLFSMARSFIMSFVPGNETGSASVLDFIPALFANLPERNEAELRLKSGSFTTSELALLFNIISVYS